MQTSVPLWVYALSLAVGPAVGGIIALLGAFGAPWIKARTDLDQWRRDKRLDAYADLARTMTEFLVAVDTYVNGVTLRPGVVDAAKEALHDVIRAEARVRLIAPETVRRESRELGRQLQRVATHLDPNLIRDLEAEARGSDELIEKARRTYDSFVNVARHDLGVP